MECVICYESLLSGRTLVCHCGHAFHSDCIKTWIDRFRTSTKLPSCPSCREPIKSLSQLIRLHLPGQQEDESLFNSAKAERLTNVAKNIHNLQSKINRDCLKVTLDNVVENIDGSDITDPTIQRVLKVLTKELRQANSRIDQSDHINNLNDKINELKSVIANADSVRRKDISRLEIQHTKSLSRASHEEHQIRNAFEKSQIEIEKLNREFALTLAKKENQIQNLEYIERQQLVKLNEKEKELSKFKMNVVEWKKKFQSEQERRQALEMKLNIQTNKTINVNEFKTPKHQKQSMRQPLQSIDTSSSTLNNSDIYSSDMDSPESSLNLTTMAFVNNNNKKRKSDETLHILPPSDDIDDALDEPLPSFANPRKRMQTSKSSIQLNQRTHKQINNNIPSSSLLALGPKLHKRMPKEPFQIKR